MEMISGMHTHTHTRVIIPRKKTEEGGGGGTYVNRLRRMFNVVLELRFPYICGFSNYSRSLCSLLSLSELLGLLKATDCVILESCWIAYKYRLVVLWHACHLLLYTLPPLSHLFETKESDSNTALKRKYLLLWFKHKGTLNFGSCLRKWCEHSISKSNTAVLFTVIFYY